jgi:hypothetical protein
MTQMRSSAYNFKKISDGEKYCNTMIIKVCYFSKGFDASFLLLYTLQAAVKQDCTVTFRNGFLTSKENESISFAQAHFNF